VAVDVADEATVDWAGEVPAGAAGEALARAAGESLTDLAGAVRAGAVGETRSDLAAVRRALLAARDARQARLDLFLARAGDSGCVIAVSTVIPGANKKPAGAEGLVGAGVAALQSLRPAAFSLDQAPLAQQDATGAPSAAFPFPHDHGEDILGEFLIFTATTDPRRMKERCVALESAMPWGRLLDLDVYDAGGRPVTRRALGLPERKCLVCEEPARDCIRLGRHREAELRARVEALLPANDERPALHGTG
jgi:phosphoribosyl-dephospho-CoA transferase